MTEVFCKISPVALDFSLGSSFERNVASISKWNVRHYYAPFEINENIFFYVGSIYILPYVIFFILFENALQSRAY